MALIEQRARTMPQTPAAALALADEALAMLPRPTPPRGRMMCMRAQALMAMERFEDARIPAGLCHQLLPDEPAAMLVAAGMHLSLKQVGPGVRLLTLALERRPALVSEVGSQTLNSVFRQLSYERDIEHRTRLVAALLKAPPGTLPPGSMSDYAQAAMETALAAGDRARALSLLDAVLAPSNIVEMLIDRRFQAIWPELERYAGTDLSAQRSAYLGAAKARLTLYDTGEAVRGYANALIATGHRGEAILLYEDWLESDAPATDRFDHGIVAISAATTLVHGDRQNEGIALLERSLATLKAGRHQGWENIVPNLALKLIDAGRHGDALAVLDASPITADALEHDAAMGYFIALRACALTNLGGTAEAAQEDVTLRSQYVGNRPAIALNTACRGSRDAQAEEWIAAVEDPDRRGGALMQFARAEVRSAAGRPPRDIYQRTMLAIVTRGDVRAAYQRHARPLPPAYRSAADDFQTAPPRPAAEGAGATAPSA